MKLDWKQDGDSLKAEAHGFTYTIIKNGRCGYDGYVSFTDIVGMTLCNDSIYVRNVKAAFQTHADVIQFAIDNDLVRKQLYEALKTTWADVDGCGLRNESQILKALAAYEKEPPTKRSRV